MPGGGSDVLLLDFMLPDANGLDRCRWVRATSALPIIMLTAQGDPTSRIVGLELGADKYLPKPFEPRELVARRDRLLDLSRAPGVNMTDRAIDLAVSRRRQKLGDSPKQPPLIRTVRGEGYVFDAEPLK